MFNFEVNGNVLERAAGVATEAIVPGGITIIGEKAFMYRRRLEKVVLPEGVTRIEHSAFYSCRDLASLTLPESLTFIGNSAFKNCESLHDIVFGGTMAQWKAIEKEGTLCETKAETHPWFECDWDYYLGAYTVHCVDGDIRNN